MPFGKFLFSYFQICLTYRLFQFRNTKLQTFEPNYIPYTLLPFCYNSNIFCLLSLFLHFSFTSNIFIGLVCFHGYGSFLHSLPSIGTCFRHSSHLKLAPHKRIHAYKSLDALQKMKDVKSRGKTHRDVASLGPSVLEKP